MRSYHVAHIGEVISYFGMRRYERLQCRQASRSCVNIISVASGNAIIEMYVRPALVCAPVAWLIAVRMVIAGRIRSQSCHRVS